MIQIVGYDPSWPKVFQNEATALRGVLGQAALAVHHVGSTAVLGMAAKPVIDIQVSVPSLKPIEPLRQALAQLGYTHVPLGPFDLAYPYFVTPSERPHTHHVHLCVYGSQQEREHLAFRDYLRTHPEIAQRYVELKRKLALENHGNALESQERYSLSKTEFVEATVSRASAEGYPCRPHRNGA